MEPPLSLRVLLASLLVSAVHGLMAADRPNILWITCEDTGPQLGCYGDTCASTPTLDALAQRGMICRNVWSTAPVCAPARTALISGLHPGSTGAEHMRSMTRLPEGAKMYPQYLREAGYYCSNNSKEDYNLQKPEGVWDQSSNRAHWRNRADGQPFFAVFNFTTTHESRVRARPHKAALDPSRVRVPAYHPDTPEVRRDWAQYYDNIATMDGQAAEVLAELEADGLTDNTIVFFYGDHGPGIARCKRFPFNSGLRVPLIVHVPERWRAWAGSGYVHQGKTDRLIGFVDLGPTVISLAGIKPPAIMQGHAFLGPHSTKDPRYLFGLRGRMDERPDLARSVFDGRYVYIRNYMPHRPWGQHVDYMFQTPTTRVWKELFDRGELTPAQSAFWEPKRPEELYDLETDPDEVRDLSRSPTHQGVLRRLRAANREHMLEIRDVGLLPEGEIHQRAGASSPYDMAHEDRRYPLEDILEAADLASMMDPGAVRELRENLKDEDSAIRYWAAMGFLMRGQMAVQDQKTSLRAALHDTSPYVRIVAAEALGRFGDAQDLEPCLEVLLECADVRQHGIHAAIAALASLDELGDRVGVRKAAIAALPDGQNVAPDRYGSYIPRLLDSIQARLDAGSN